MGNLLVRVLLSALVLVAAALVMGAGTASAQERYMVVGPDVLNVREAPDTSSPVVEVLEQGEAVEVEGSVAGEEVFTGNVTWFRVPNGYIYSAHARPYAGTADSAGMTGRWIEVDRTDQIARAIEDGEIVYQAPVTVGVQAWPTPTGRFEIIRRVANETMNSATIGINPDTPDGYYLEDVLYTQYITDTGVAFHYNYWTEREAFGSYPASHGCIGMMLEDAEFFWEFGELGMTVIITR
jgi:lipoprotein-anchoring transpeptidase ErfK/SrfK